MAKIRVWVNGTWVSYRDSKGNIRSKWRPGYWKYVEFPGKPPTLPDPFKRLRRRRFSDFW